MANGHVAYMCPRKRHDEAMTHGQTQTNKIARERVREQQREVKRRYRAT